MKKYVSTLFISTLFTLSTFAQFMTSDTCIIPGGGGPGGNIVIFANYDGGVLNINVDQNIPNLKIGICTYEPVTINLAGAYVGNVTEVRYAGYVSTSNHHCSNSPTTTTINGAPGGAATSVNFLPSSTYNNPNGYSSIVCAYSCDNNSNQGGCNTADQVQNYFATTMGGSVYSYYTQYGCWSTVPYAVSAGGNCALGGQPDTLVTAFSSSATATCVNTAVNFTNLSPGTSSSWTWTAAGSSIPTSSSQHLTGVTWSSPGTYTVILAATDSSGTCNTMMDIIVQPSPTLNLTAVPDPICAGDTTVLHASGAFTYIWGNGPTTDTWEVHPTTDTWYTLLAMGMNGCMASDSILVTVYPIPATPTVTYSGGILTAAPSTAPLYQWYLNGNPISGANTFTYTPAQNGVYTVGYLDMNACSSAVSAPVTVTDIGAGVDEVNGKLQIFPNPGAGLFQVNIPGAPADMLVEVMDISGRVLYTKTVLMTGTYWLDLSGYAKGMYEVRISNGKKIFTGKLIVQ